MKKILFIAWYFPPLGGVASIRSLKHVQHLSEMGYEVQVLTIRTRFMHYPKDPFLLRDLPAETKIWRAFCPDANWLFKALWGLKLPQVVKFLRQKVFSPDPEKLWLPFARRRLSKIMASGTKFDLAVISSGPPSSLTLGLYLKQRHGIPFICDFRDEWTNNPERINLEFPVRAQQRERKLESLILTECAGIACLTDIMHRNFIQLAPQLQDKPHAIIPNGFNEDEFKGLESTHNQDAFHLVYSGSFYDRRQPDSLWEAISRLLDTGRLKPGELVVDIYGRNTASFVLGSYAQDARIVQMVRFHGFLPHRTSLREMMKGDALLLYIPSGKNTDSVLTGKIFDYLRAGKPILAIVPPQGLAAEIVARAGTGWVADYQDIEGIMGRIESLFAMWKQGTLSQIQADQEYVAGFSRRELARRLAALIEEVLR